MNPTSLDDTRYSELVFLQKLKTNSPEFNLFRGHPKQAEIVGLSHCMYVDMAMTLLEEGMIRFQDQDNNVAVAHLRGELSSPFPMPLRFHDYQWTNPRRLVHDILNEQCVHKLEITYRGLRRIEELRELLRRERVLERFGVLLDFRYVQKDLEQALHRSSDIPISVLYADLDQFKPVNDNYGHEAGDIVLKSYLEVVKDTIGSFGTGYRGTGDEVVVIIIGQGHERSIEISEKIRASVEGMKCQYQDQCLPCVTTSIGVATSPPESRSIQIESIAEGRNREAKKLGRNRVISFS